MERHKDEIDVMAYYTHPALLYTFYEQTQDMSIISSFNNGRAVETAEE